MDGGPGWTTTNACPSSGTPALGIWLCYGAPVFALQVQIMRLFVVLDLSRKLFTVGFYSDLACFLVPAVEVSVADPKPHDGGPPWSGMSFGVPVHLWRR